MSRRRNRIFGPIMYAALLAWGLVAIYSGVEFATPRVENWLEQRRILKALRSPDIKTRQGVVLDLEHKSPAFARAYLVEALGDPSLDVRLAACHSLAHHGCEPQSLIPGLAAAADDAGPGRTALRRRSRRAAGRARLPKFLFRTFGRGVTEQKNRSASSRFLGKLSWFLRSRQGKEADPWNLPILSSPCYRTSLRFSRPRPTRHSW